MAFSRKGMTELATKADKKKTEAVAGDRTERQKALDMALAGIESRIPVDEVIDAMGDVGRRMPVEFRETALGGLAATPTGEALRKQVFGT